LETTPTAIIGEEDGDVYKTENRLELKLDAYSYDTGFDHRQNAVYATIRIPQILPGSREGK
jgi:hypothetical protein